MIRLPLIAGAAVLVALPAFALNAAPPKPSWSASNLALTSLMVEARAETSTSILPTLPAEVQKRINGIRAECRQLQLKTSEGDEGLSLFTVSGAEAVLIDELDLCNDGICIHGVNCATGYSHSVEIHVRSGTAWKEALSVDATERIFLSVQPYGDQFRALVLSVHGGDKGCPIRDENDSMAWKREKCEFVIKWDGANFVWTPLEVAIRNDAVENVPRQPEEPSLLQTISAFLWAVGGSVNCGVPAKTYSLQIASDSIVWRSGVGNADFESINFNSENQAQTITLHSEHRTGRGETPGTTWSYKKLGPDRVQVIPGGRSSFVLTRCR
jgi:hypothetical protein